MLIRSKLHADATDGSQMRGMKGKEHTHKEPDKQREAEVRGRTASGVRFVGELSFPGARVAVGEDAKDLTQPCEVKRITMNSYQRTGWPFCLACYQPRANPSMHEVQDGELHGRLKKEAHQYEGELACKMRQAARRGCATGKERRKYTMCTS